MRNRTNISPIIPGKIQLLRNTVIPHHLFSNQTRDKKTNGNPEDGDAMRPFAANHLTEQALQYRSATMGLKQRLNIRQIH